MIGFAALAAVVIGWLPVSWFVPLAVGSAVVSLIGLILFPCRLSALQHDWRRGRQRRRPGCRPLVSVAAKRSWRLAIVWTAPLMGSKRHSALDRPGGGRDR